MFCADVPLFAELDLEPSLPRSLSLDSDENLLNLKPQCEFVDQRISLNSFANLVNTLGYRLALAFEKQYNGVARRVPL